MSKRSRLLAVSFDVGGTLIEPWPSVGHVYAEVAAEAGHAALDPALLTAQFMAAWSAKADFDYSPAAWLQVVDQTFSGLLPDGCRAETFFDRLYDRFAEARAWRIYDDVLGTLHGLSRLGLPLAAISNWDGRLRPLLHDLRLDTFFQVVAVSGERGYHKPARQIFDWTVERLGVPANCVLHVGDSVREDVEGARAAGLESVLLRRGVAEVGEGIRSLGELAGMRV